MIMMNSDTPVVQRNADDDEIQLTEVWSIVRRNKWLILWCFLGTTGAALAYALTSRPVFESATTVRIDEKQTNLPVLDVLKSLAAGNEVSTEMQVLRSRTLAAEVVDSLSLQVSLAKPKALSREEVFAYVVADTAAPEATYTFERRAANEFVVEDATRGVRIGVFTPGQPIALAGVRVALLPAANAHETIEVTVAPRAAALESLLESVRVTRPDREANVVMVGFRGTDRQLVAEVPNLLARRFINLRRGVQQTEARSTVRFLREQIDTLESQLADAENDLKEFREGEQVVSLVDEARAQVGRLADLQAQRSTLDAERSALARLLEEVKAAAAVHQPDTPSPYRRLIAFPTLLRNQAAAALLTSLATVEDQRAALLNRRTPQDSDVQVLTGRVVELEEQLRSIAVTYLEGLTNQVAAIDATLAQFGAQLAKVPAKQIEVARLERRPSILQDIYVLLQTRLKEAEIIEAVEDPSVRVVDAAVPADKPVGGKRKLIVVLGALFGVAGGIAIAFLREHMDRSVHTRDDLQDATALPVLGLIPRIREAHAANIRAGAFGRVRAAMTRRAQLDPVLAGRRKTHAGGRISRELEFEERLVTGVDPRNPVAEAYRSLRTAITFARPEEPVKSLVFTSPMPGEGKSTTAANLAITLVQQGLRVLLIDADLRRGLLNDAFRTTRDPGLSNVLMNAIALEAAVRPIPFGESALDFLPTGTMPPNPAELLGSARMRTLLEHAEGIYDVIIMDAPPLNLVTDAAVLGTAADGVVIVARAGVTHRGALQYTMDLLRNARIRPLGTVLNDIDFKRDIGYYRSYGYGYYQYYSLAGHES